MTTAQCRRPRLTAAVASAFAIIVLVTSCSTKTNTSAPTKLPPITATPTPTPTPTPEAQVESAVRFYYETANRAITNGDTAKLLDLSSPGCTCRKLVDTVNDVYANGASNGARFDVHSIDVREIQGITAAAEVVYDVSDYVVLDKQGAVLERVPASHADALMSMVWNDSAWITADIVQLNNSNQ